MRAHLWSQVSLTHNQVNVWLHILFYATVKPAAHGTSEDSSTAAATNPVLSHPLVTIRLRTEILLTGTSFKNAVPFVGIAT